MLIICVTKVTHADRVDVMFTIMVGYALMFGMNLWLFRALAGAIPAVRPSSDEVDTIIVPDCGGIGERLPREDDHGAAAAGDPRRHEAPPARPGRGLFRRRAGRSFPTHPFASAPVFQGGGQRPRTVVAVCRGPRRWAARRPIASLEGPVRIKIPAGTRSGRVFRVAGKGLGKEGGGRGDLLAAVRIDLPEKMDPRMEKL